MADVPQAMPPMPGPSAGTHGSHRMLDPPSAGAGVRVILKAYQLLSPTSPRTKPPPAPTFLVIPSFMPASESQLGYDLVPSQQMTYDSANKTLHRDRKTMEKT